VYSIQSLNLASNGEYNKITHNPYKINFQFGIKVALSDNTLVSRINSQYIPLFVLNAPGFETDYLISKLKYDG